MIRLLPSNFPLLDFSHFSAFAVDPQGGFPFFFHVDSKGDKECQSCRSSRKMLQNEYLVAKIGGGTAENEPRK